MRHVLHFARPKQTNRHMCMNIYSHDKPVATRWSCRGCASHADDQSIKTKKKEKKRQGKTDTSAHIACNMYISKLIFTQLTSQQARSQGRPDGRAQPARHVERIILHLDTAAAKQVVLRLLHSGWNQVPFFGRSVRFRDVLCVCGRGIGLSGKDSKGGDVVMFCVSGMGIGLRGKNRKGVDE